MRPRTLDEVRGQAQVSAPDAPLRLALARGLRPSVLLWGPPGCGKTSLARVLAGAYGLPLHNLAAVSAGLKELREALGADRAAGGLFGDPRPPLIFVDEIHRWNKAQQDALLPWVEEGRAVLIGATTENPAFSINPALRSRCWLLMLDPLGPDVVGSLLDDAWVDAARGLGQAPGTLPATVRAAILRQANGDARRALTLLERWSTAGERDPSPAAIQRVLGTADTGHDHDGDAHHDVTSALIKSMRGSNPDAALYWLARMLEGGEDPRFIARRLVIFASEDVGNADARALLLASAALDAAERIGMPEVRIVLGQVTTFLATAPKSNAAYKGIDAAIADVRAHGARPVPAHLRLASTAFDRARGEGAGYLYPHDHPDAHVAQQYLPEGLDGVRFYEPSARGGEKDISARLAHWRERDREGRRTGRD